MDGLLRPPGMDWNDYRNGSNVTVAASVSQRKVYHRKRTFWWSARYEQFVPIPAVAPHATVTLRQLCGARSLAASSSIFSQKFAPAPDPVTASIQASNNLTVPPHKPASIAASPQHAESHPNYRPRTLGQVPTAPRA